MVRESGSPVCSHVGPSSMYDTRQLGLPSRDGQEIGLVRKTGVLASGKYYGRHLKKIQIAISPRRIIRFRFTCLPDVFGSRTGFSGSADRIALFPVLPNSISMREKQYANSN